MAKEKHSLLTVKLKPDLYVEFQVALDILRERSISEFIHNVVRQTIKEAGKEVPKEEFAALAAQKAKEIREHSLAKSREAKRRNQKAGSPAQRNDRAA